MRTALKWKNGQRRKGSPIAPRASLREHQIECQTAPDLTPVTTERTTLVPSFLHAAESR